MADLECALMTPRTRDGHRKSSREASRELGVKTVQILSSPTHNSNLETRLSICGFKRSLKVSEVTASQNEPKTSLVNDLLENIG
jgi:hypothetical protein